MFPHDQTTRRFPPSGGWFNFECNADGRVDRDALPECARNNFDMCCLTRLNWWIETETRDVRTDGLMKCDCDKELVIFSSHDIHCDCGRSYNSAGQLLAPREQWGEETGETAADYDRGVADPEAAFSEDY